MNGGKTNKRSLWINSVPELHGIQARCDGLHPHLPWGAVKLDGAWTFATAQEAEFMGQLCECALQCLMKNDIVRGLSSSTLMCTRADIDARAAVLQRQPRGKRSAPLVAESSR